MLSIFSPLCIKQSQPAICTIVLCVYDEPSKVKKYRILTEFEVFMYWKDPPRANRDAEPRSGEALRFVRAGLSST